MDNYQKLLKKIGTGYVSSTAYDTAWTARLIEYDPVMSNHALEWLCENQLPDGSWGVKQPYYYHDRVICTLAAMIALNFRGRRTRDKTQIEKGLLALDQITNNATRELGPEAYPATVGFEVIVPTLVNQAEQLGIIKQQGDRILGKLGRLRKAKMEKLAGIKISRITTIAHSAEMAGTDNLDLLDANNLQEENGSVSNNPAATAYFAMYVKPGDEKALKYLQKVATDDGGIPSFAPFDIFERVWVLWNLLLTEEIKNPQIKDLCDPHVDYIEKNWKPQQGLGFSAEYSLTDGDDTSVGHKILSSLGRKCDLSSLHIYEEKEWFRCYHLEVNPSIDVNIHFLGTLSQIGYEISHPSIKKIINFLRSSQNKSGYWFDKWHVSPYYTTSHAVMACLKYDEKMSERAVNWILDTQKSDGSWGFYDFPTAEESAYCIQALHMWQSYGKKGNKDTMKKAKNWLVENYQLPHPPLWMDKSLYSPEVVVQSVILSALSLAKDY